GLVAMHGQHEHHALLDTDTQTELLDAYAATDLRLAVAAAHATWTAAVATLADLERLKSRGQREQEYLRWQLEELTAAGVRAGEDLELAAERGAVRHAARLAELGQSAADALREESVARGAASVRAAAELDPRLSELASRLELLEQEASEAAAELRRYTDALDADPARLEAIESRLATLDGIKRKHGGSLEAAIEEERRLRTQLDATEDLGAALAKAELERARSRAQLEAAAARLTSARS